MTRLDRSANDVIRLARKRALEEIKEIKPKLWKGVKIIPLKEWKKKLNLKTREWTEYYPNKYDPYLLPYAGHHTVTKKIQDKWLTGFEQYMELVKDSEFGKYKCSECILNPVDSEPNSPRTTTIRDAISKTHQSSDGLPLEFPCQVVNMFKCPYENKDDQLDFIIFGRFWRILEDAIEYNEKLVERRHNMYTVDFDKNQVRAAYLNIGFEVHTVEQLFSKLEFSKVEILGHRGLYDAITTRDKLKSVVTEYWDAVVKGSEISIYPLETIEYLRKDPDYFLDVFDKIRHVMVFEDLKNTDGMTLRDVEKKNKENEEFLAERRTMARVTPTYEPEQKKLSDNCFSCGEFANIFCGNCNIWTCLAHGMDHAVQAHNYVKPQSLTLNHVSDAETNLNNRHEITHVKTGQKEQKKYEYIKNARHLTHYDILGVDRHATQDEITNRYRRLVLVWHPDQNRTKPDAAEYFKIINDAYEVLRDKDKRREYDTSLGF